MKVTVTKTVLLSVALAGTMASCQKEEILSEMVPSQEMSLFFKAHVSLTLRFWVDGVEYRKVFESEAEKKEYISYLIGLTLEGKDITIGGNPNPSFAPEADDKLTIETTDKDVIDAWAVEMEGKGYKVSCRLDKERGLYTGTATPVGGRTITANLSEKE